MKISLKITAAVALAVITLLAGCRKEDRIDDNTFIIAGNSNSSYNREIVPEDCLIFPEDIIQCTPEMYRHDLLIRFLSGESMYIEINKTASSSAVPVGSFPFSGQCQEGSISYFFLQDSRKSAGLYFSSGSITVSRNGDVYDIDIDMKIDQNSGGGTLKGNFHGPIQPGEAR